MGYLKIIFYGLLAFIERNPKFCLLLVLIAVFAPFIFRWVGWLLLIIIGVALLGLAFAILRFKRMQKQMEEQMRQTGGGFSGMGGFSTMGGFSNMGGANGMTLEELVRQMQAQADARKAQQPKQNTTTSSKSVSGVDTADYVDFEEVE
ncbi:MAG: hypothetical protein J6V55_00825 [Alistipes sp.]|nr:hypothetical protein [Alistipes sp.]